jgi:hypothetical protein
MNSGGLMRSFDEFREMLLEAAPEAAEPLEIAALSESLGLTDADALRLGFDDVFAFAERIFVSDYKNQFQQPTPGSRRDRTNRWVRELKCAGAKLANGLAYSLPWMCLTVAETFFPHAFEIPPALGSALSLSLIASLISTGGIAQAIGRDVTFFLALGEPYLARQVVQRLMRYGATAALLCASSGCILCLYFGLFSLRYVAIAATHYLLLCALWMLCAILCAQGFGVLLPLVLLGSAGLIVGAHLLWHPSSVVLLLLWPVLAGAAALLCSGIISCRAERRGEARVNGFLPHKAIHSYMLLPILVYGIAYFGFLFADRLSAGSAVAWSSGLPFGVDPLYKKAMDLALFGFLLEAIVVEYLSDLFIRFWWSRVSVAQQTSTTAISRILRRRYCLGAALVGSSFSAILLAACHYLPERMGLQSSRVLDETLWFGGVGYLILSVTLFGGVILLSVDAVSAVAKAAGMGLAVNLLIGYTLSHAVAMQFASVGLLAGACVFTWQVHKTLWKVLAHPDYYYSLV